MIFENFIPKAKLLKTKFPADTEIHNFLVRLPLLDHDDILKPVDLKGYFQAILTGCVSLKDLIGDLQYTTASADNKDDATMTLRDHEEINYAESQQVIRTPVKNADKIAIVLNEDTYTNEKNCITCWERSKKIRLRCSRYSMKHLTKRRRPLTVKKCRCVIMNCLFIFLLQSRA